MNLIQETNLILLENTNEQAIGPYLAVQIKRRSDACETPHVLGYPLLPLYESYFFPIFPPGRLFLKDDFPLFCFGFVLICCGPHPSVLKV